MRFSGSYVAIVTPWNKDLSGIDFGVLEELIEWQITSGTDGILPAGTTGESPTLSHEEHEELIVRTVKLAAGRAKVVAGAGSNSTAESISLAKAAKAAGADAIMSVTPYYNRPTQEGLVRHFSTVAENCDLPTMIYNIPSRTGVTMLSESIARVNRDFPHVSAVKEATGNIDNATQLVSLTDMDILSGDDSLTLPIMSVGGKGVVSVIANIAPAETKRMVTAALADDYAKAREWHHKLYPIMKECFIETNPGPVKTALRLMGRAGGRMRLPMVEPSPESEKRILAALKKVGLAT
ncbi:MAG: 4-hydroxy-tetrahydrodipicolinate synthase [Planctomycetes bacterium]|nr:4-hydroxy-tetrahydrodipicolinate synthase [Planctomycetota bacterium]